MKKNPVSTIEPQEELELSSESFSYKEYSLLREGLLFLEQRPRPRDLKNLIHKLDRLFLPLWRRHATTKI